MFEKEAKEYSTSQKIDYVNNIAITLVQQAYKDGAEFGYNKANEWHYVKDGDLPKSNKLCLLYLGNHFNQLQVGLTKTNLFGLLKMIEI